MKQVLSFLIIGAISISAVGAKALPELKSDSSTVVLVEHIKDLERKADGITLANKRAADLEKAVKALEQGLAETNKRINNAFNALSSILNEVSIKVFTSRLVL